MRKREIKKMPPRAREGGNENELGGKVFYPEYSTIPKEQQIDYYKLADVLRLHAEIYDLRAQEAVVMALIKMGGTIYPLDYGVVHGTDGN